MVPRLVVLDQAASTNDELAILVAREACAPYTTVVTSDQTAGRGRRDRAWSSPPGSGLAISVLLPLVPDDRMAWLALAAGLAMREAVASVLPGVTVSVKWPNDVLIGDRKVCGLLAEVNTLGVVMGTGLNVRLQPHELPVPTATSLIIEGAVDEALDDRILAGYLARLRSRVDGLVSSDAEGAGLRVDVISACDTIGRNVRIELPDGSTIAGVAVDIAADGRLVVRTGDRTMEWIAAGDVVHVRRMVG
jgi:BirA family biotin operon repressor/biotin-[acetyl-CoA-carboxylase] ligase